jgi:hypothetical protein
MSIVSYSALVENMNDPREREYARIIDIIDRSSTNGMAVPDWPILKTQQSNKFDITVYTGLNRRLVYFEAVATVTADTLCDIYRKCFFDMYSKYIIQPDKPKHIIKYENDIEFDKKAYFTFDDDITIYNTNKTYIEKVNILVNDIISTATQVETKEEKNFKEIHQILYWYLTEQSPITTECKHKDIKIKIESYKESLKKFTNPEHNMANVALLTYYIMHWYTNNNYNVSCS